MIKILLFGRLAEICGASELRRQAASTGELLHQLQEEFPALKEHTRAISVNRKLIDGSVSLQAGDEVALMPPYSGG